MHEDVLDEIRCFIMFAYHNLERGDCDLNFVHTQLTKALKIVEREIISEERLYA